MRATMNVRGAIAVGACAASAALGQLRQDEVLVIYDSRIADSRDVAEYYAGSARVPGGAGNLPGVRPRVRVFNLADSGAPVTTPGDISYPDFITRLRTPIRNHLTAHGLVQSVRCFVMTKGLPHRVQDTDFPTVGDNPTNLSNELSANDATCASADTELVLLWHDLTAGENGGAADSRADGLILNPYWKSALPIGSYPTVNIQAPKTYTAGGVGPLWSPAGTGAPRLTPGDMYLVSRLDGPTVAVVRSTIDRARAFVYNVSTHALLFDESNSNGVADFSANSELDNSGSAWGALRAGDDYELCRDALVADGRWAATMRRYDALGGAANFFVGPGRTWSPGQGTLVTDPVVMVASYGANHAGIPFTQAGENSRDFYATTFNIAPGAIINTIESYSGRDFGGLGQIDFVPQQQVSSFLAAGGTFGIGNVWEPLADSIGDNQYLVSNFILGHLSWGEAAWTAIPAISWMQIVIGDPLARVVRSSEDITTDARASIDDLHAWEQLPAQAPQKDLNRDGAADAADRAFIVRTLRAYERQDMINRRP